MAPNDQIGSRNSQRLSNVHGLVIYTVASAES